MTSTVPAAEPTTPYRSVDPATGRLLAEYPIASDAEVQEALAAADAAYRSWREVPIQEREAVAARVGTLFTERVEELAAIITQEMGKPIAEAREEVAFCAEIFAYYAENGPALAADQPLTTTAGGRRCSRNAP